MRSLGIALSCTCFFVLAGCASIADLDRFDKVDDAGVAGAAGGDAGAGGAGGMDAGPPGGGPDAGPPDAGRPDGGVDDPACGDGRTLCVTLRGFSLHTEDLTLVDLVTPTDDGPRLLARALLDPFGQAGQTTTSFAMPLAAPDTSEPLQVFIWADQDNDERFDFAGDHYWVRNDPTPDVFEDLQLSFTHVGQFDDHTYPPTPIGGPFRMRIQDDGNHTGQMLEVHVIEQASRRTVGLLRVQRIPAQELVLSIADIIDPTSTYEVALYVDVNENGRYDAPPADHAYTMRALTPSQDGLLLVDEPFVLSSNEADFVDVSFVNVP